MTELDEARRCVLAERRSELAAIVEDAKGEIAQIDDVFREEGLGTRWAGDLSVVVSVNRRLDAAAFEQAYPSVEFPSFYKPTPDTTAIRKAIAPAALDHLYRDGTPSVRVTDRKVEK